MTRFEEQFATSTKGSASLFECRRRAEQMLSRDLMHPLWPGLTESDWERDAKALARDVIALADVIGDAQSVVDDYSDGRLDSLVALGKIGLRLLKVTG